MSKLRKNGSVPQVLQFHHHDKNIGLLLDSKPGVGKPTAHRVNKVQNLTGGQVQYWSDL